MQLGGAIGSPPRDCKSLGCGFSGLIKLARAKQDLGEIRQHACFEFEACPRGAGKVDRLAKVTRPCVKIASGRFRQPRAGDRRDTKVWRAR